jgi:sporulation integral membrane protein YtvI
MDKLFEKLCALDIRYKHVPRKLFLIAVVCLLALLVFKVLPFVWPFVFGFLFSLLLRKPARWISKLIKARSKVAKPIVLVLMVLLYGVIFVAVILLISRLFYEAQRLFNNAPAIINWVQQAFDNWLERLWPKGLETSPDSVQVLIDAVLDSFRRFVQNIASKATPVVAQGAWTTVTGIPGMLLFIVMTVMSSFYFTSDNDRIQAYFRKILPVDFVKKADNLIKDITFAGFQQMKAQLIISFIIMVMLVVVFTIFGFDYSLLLGIAIGIVDVLPVLGAGTILIPWALFNLLAGELTIGLQLVVMYILVVVVRQIIEPRIVSNKLGLYPLVSMVSMYIGFVTIGFLGLIIGPFLANVCKVVLLADEEYRLAQQKKAGTAEAEA